jgi:hypothetical protein
MIYRGTLIVFWNTYDMAVPAFSFPRARARAQCKLCKAPADCRLGTYSGLQKLPPSVAQQASEIEQPPATNQQLPYLLSIINGKW